MAAIVVLGFKERGLDAKPHLIYSGNNGDEALAAAAKLHRGDWDDVREYRNLRQLGFKMRVPEVPVVPAAKPAPAPTTTTESPQPKFIKLKK